MSLTPVYGAKAPLTVTGLATLASQGFAASNELDFTALGAIGLSLDNNLSIAVPEAKFVYVYLQGTNTTGVYGSFSGDGNLKQIGAIDMSEATPQMDIQINDLPPFGRIVYFNDCANPLTAGAADYRTKTVNNV